MFQSLLCWIRDSDMQNVYLAERATPGFQSLLCWIRDSDDSDCRIIWKDRSRFNPCSVGLGIQTSVPATIPVAQGCCFNPCSVGLGIQTTFYSTPWRWFVKFQSLLCWIRDSDGKGSVFIKDDLKFQSLLCWIRDSDFMLSITIFSALVSFNPCSVGLGIQTTGLARFAGVFDNVSILALLD